jgi:hypothetical protein
MRIIVDADACPALNLIEKTASSFNIEAIYFCDNTHNIKSDYAKVIIADKGYQNVDMLISNSLKKDDILVTQDYGLALIALTKNANALHPKGTIYTNESLDIMLTERHINATLRRNGVKTKGPKKRTNFDDINLIDSLEKLINGK